MAFPRFTKESARGAGRVIASLLPGRVSPAVPRQWHRAGDIGDTPWAAPCLGDSSACPRQDGDTAFSTLSAVPSSWKGSLPVTHRQLPPHDPPVTHREQQGRDRDGLWLCWWLHQLTQVMSRASLSVEKREPTRRRAAFEFWTLNKVLISSRARVFSFPSPPLNALLYLFIFLFICFCLLLHSQISNSSNMTGLWSRLLACNASLCWSWADCSSPWLFLWTAKSEENPAFSKPEGGISWYRSCGHRRPAWI